MWCLVRMKIVDHKVLLTDPTEFEWRCLFYNHRLPDEKKIRPIKLKTNQDVLFKTKNMEITCKIILFNVLLDHYSGTSHRAIVQLSTR